jgi:hypothetical protein
MKQNLQADSASVSRFVICEGAHDESLAVCRARQLSRQSARPLKFSYIIGFLSHFSIDTSSEFLP